MYLLASLMVLSESQSRRQRRLGMEHTNFQAQAGTALRYDDQRVLDADGPPAQGANAAAERRSGDDVGHEVAKERKTIDSTSINNPAKNLNRQIGINQGWRQRCWSHTLTTSSAL